MTVPAIDSWNLRKVFGDTVAVADLSLTVQPGEVFGFLGPNGAGKTTVVKMLLGLVFPTSGQGELLGVPLGVSEVRRRVGYLPEHFRFYDWLTAQEFLTLHANLLHMHRSRQLRCTGELLNLVGLKAHAHRRLGGFSKGMLQRVGLAQALLNKPDLVILDDPTSGLDPLGRRLVRSIVGQLRQRGTAVFLSSHYLTEVELTCDRVAFIKEGVVVHTSRVGELLDQDTVVDIRAGNLTRETVDGLARYGKLLTAEGNRVSVSLAEEESLPLLNSYLVEQGAEVYALAPRRASLEELFIEIVGEGPGP